MAFLKALSNRIDFLPPSFRVPAFLKKRTTWLNWGWGMLLILALAYQTHLAIEYKSNDTTNLPLIIGRVGAYNLLILIALLWLPVMRHTTTWLYSTPLKNWLPLDAVKSIHKWLGHALFIGAMVHGVGYLVYFSTLDADFFDTLFGREPDLVRSMKTTMYEFVTEDESIDKVHEWIINGQNELAYHESIAPLMKEDCTKCHSEGSTMTYAIPSLPLTNYESVKSLSGEGVMSRQFRINISGIAMFGFFALIWFTSLDGIRKKYYHWFQDIHRLGYLVAILALLHIPRFEYCLLPALILFVELWLNRKHKVWRDCPTEIRPVGQFHFFMKINLPVPIQLKPGHFVQIRVKNLHRTEWHSISTLNEGKSVEKIELLIKNLGDWTGELCDFSQRQSQLPVCVRGAWASPIAHMVKVKNGFCVAGGIGITPIVSLLNHAEKSDLPWERFEMVWVFRDWHLFEELSTFILRVQLRLPMVRWKLFATSPQPSDVSISDRLNVHCRRPNLESKLLDFEEGIQGKIHAFVCSPKGMSDEIKKLTQHKNQWEVLVENF